LVSSAGKKGILVALANAIAYYETFCAELSSCCLEGKGREGEGREGDVVVNIHHTPIPSPSPV
jgi:hypothetical protein